MINKVLFVEDGSVDVDEVAKIFPYMPIIVYRQGSPKPEFVDFPRDDDTALIDTLRFVQERALDKVEKVLKKHIMGSERTLTENGPKDEKIFISAQSLAALMKEIRDELGDFSDKDK